MSQAHKWKKLSNCRFPMVEIHPKPNLAWFHIEIFYISLPPLHVPMIWKLKTVNREPVGGLKCPRTAGDLFMGSTPSPSVFSPKMVIKMSCLFSVTFQEDRTASLTSERQSKRQQIRNAAQAWSPVRGLYMLISLLFLAESCTSPGKAMGGMHRHFRSLENSH